MEEGQLIYLGKAGKEAEGYKFEEVLTKNIIVRKIWRDKDFKDKLEIGEIGIAKYTNVWINSWNRIENREEDKPRILTQTESYPPEHKVESFDTDDVSKEIEVLEKKFKPAQLVSLGMTFGNANSCASTLLQDQPFNDHNFNAVADRVYLRSLKAMLRWHGEK